MRILELIIYGYFYIQLFKWVLTLVIYCSLNPIARVVRNVRINISVSDNILWIAPVIYFSGGLS